MMSSDDPGPVVDHLCNDVLGPEASGSPSLKSAYIFENLATGPLIV